MTLIKTLQIVSKGRKYFDCKLDGKYPAKLIINDISKNAEIGVQLFFSVNDLSKRSSYGSELIYEPLAIMTNEAEVKSKLKAEEQAKECEKWLKFAEKDALERGYYHSSAIENALSLCTGTEYDERMKVLKDRLRENLKTHEEAKKERQRIWDAEKKEKELAYLQRASKRFLFPLDERPELNVPLRSYEKVIVFTSYGKSFHSDDDASSLYGTRWLGREGELGCYCYYRDATEEEIASLEASEAEAKAAKARRKAWETSVATIEKAIIENGSRPGSQDQPILIEGQTCIDTFNIYGGGTQFVVGTEFIWFVRNNGADGDNWSNNNVRTGGAGAIGWRIPYSQEIADDLLRLNKERGNI